MGGWYYNAWNYSMTNPIQTETDYPYDSASGISGSCKYDTSKGIGKAGSYTIVATDTESIKSALNQQPCSVAIQATSPIFLTYSSGVITSPRCGTNVGHAVLAVGYGGNYYIVKNTYGSSWGEDGYVRIGMADGAGICGIN